MRVRVDLNISLDGFASTADQTPEDPMGTDWSLLTEAYVGTRTFRTRVLGDTSGAGTTGVDDRYGAAYFEGVGAEIMGAGMFGLHAHPDDPDWQGWWGETPPFDCPVFVLTGRRRPPLELGGTTFHFVSEEPATILDRAAESAHGQDVRIGGGVRVARDFLAAGLVDDLHVAVTPILLGSGQRLWDDLRHLEEDYAVSSEVAESGVVHVTFRR